MKTINRKESVFYQIIVIAAIIGLAVFVVTSITSCSDPSQDIEIVDGEKAQPEGQKSERGITIDTSR